MMSAQNSRDTCWQLSHVIGDKSKNKIKSGGF